MIRLLHLALDHWASFHGRNVGQGIDDVSLDLNEFCDLVYWWATRNGSEEDTAKLDQELWKIPPSVAKKDRALAKASYDKKMSDFWSMGAAFN